MITCDMCGGIEFEKHEGFMYCIVCQTQSQSYLEQEYAYTSHEANISRRFKPDKTAKKSKRQKEYDDGSWTTWEAFNYILYGMTEEVKKCGASEEAGNLVLKLWAAYLQECHAAFISMCQEKLPKLNLTFKNRDAKILYNIDTTRRRVSVRRRSYSSASSNTSRSILESRRSIHLQKRKVIAADYQDYLSLSTQSTNNLADETLESLGRSSDHDTTDNSSDTSESQLKSLKSVLVKKDYKMYKELNTLRNWHMVAKDKHEINIRSLGKNKLLALIHLALLMTGSEIQLSDLLRFIRESHLSFAKVTHFFPKEMKFPKKDFAYIEILSDSLMPTHSAQRKLVGKLAKALRVEKIPTPDLAALIERYCRDLNLPNHVADLGKDVAADHFPDTVEFGKTKFSPNYEAWAMACVIFALKFFLGLNDKTENFLSRLAREINNLGSSENRLFVFRDWQKFIECRKAVLINFHYPTEEVLGGSPFQNSKKFLSVLMKESKDEHRDERFIRYPRYYIEENFLSGVKEMLNSLAKPQNITYFDFKPSLTPQISNLETIMQELSQESNAAGEDDRSSAPVLPEKILKEDFRSCDLKFSLDPKRYLKMLEESSDLFTEFGINKDSSDDSFQKNKGNLDVLFDCQSRYWILRMTENFQWLIKECARMLEMNVRELYLELLRMEVLLSSELSRKR